MIPSILTFELDIILISDKDLHNLGMVRTSTTRMPFMDKRGKNTTFRRRKESTLSKVGA